MSKLYILGLAILASLIIGLSLADEMTFSTYYPAPYGVYREMVVAHRQSIGDVNNDGKYGADDMAVSFDGWNYNPLPGSLTVAGNVGIGTTEPYIFGGSPTDRKVLTIQGPSRGSLELATGATDAADVCTGDISFTMPMNTAGKDIAAIAAETEGAASNARGGRLGFYTRTPGGGIPERMRIDSTGNVGIGTTAPQAKLDVSDPGNNVNAGIKLGFDDSTPGSAKAGTMRYNNGKMEYCNGSGWQMFGGPRKIPGSDFNVTRGSVQGVLNIAQTKPAGASENAFPIITEFENVFTGDYMYVANVKGYWME